MTSFFFWISYLYLPFAGVCVYFLRKTSGVLRVFACLALLVSSLLAYARFVEPRILSVHEETIITHGADDASPSLRIALFSDMHFGVFKNAIPMSRIVKKVNAQKPDAVFIAGDFLYKLKPEDIPEAIAPLRQLEVPTYAVIGNHDVGYSTTILYDTLRDLGVTLVQNRAYEATIAGQDILIGGASNLWLQPNNFTFTNNLPDKPLFLLTHSPDTGLAVPQDVPFALLLAGHTHGGQVRIPGLVRAVIPTKHPFDKGLYKLPSPSGERLIYVTPGTGMSGLPLRFNMPPRIDVLTVHVPAAG